MKYISFFIQNLFFIFSINSNYFILNENKGLINIFSYDKNPSSCDPFYNEKIILSAGDSNGINFKKLLEENKNGKNNFIFIKTTDISKEKDKYYLQRNKNEIIDYFVFFENEGDFFFEKNKIGKFEKNIYKFFKEKINFDSGFLNELLLEKNHLFKKSLMVDMENEFKKKTNIVIFNNFGINKTDEKLDLEIGFLKNFVETCKEDKNFILAYFTENKNIIGQMKFTKDIEDNSIYVNTFQINDFCIGYGFGKQIMENLINFAKEKGIEKISLDSFESSQGFYEKMGFLRKEVGTEFIRFEKEI